MNKKISIIPVIIVIAIIVAFSQMNLEPTEEEKSIPVEIENVEEETTILMPVKSARPDCGPNAECYIPSYYTAKVNETITWKNQDSAFHSVTSGSYENPDGLFDSGHIDPHESFSYTFEESGPYPYHCTLHPWMAGTILVKSEIDIVKCHSNQNKFFCDPKNSEKIDHELVILNDAWKEECEKSGECFQPNSLVIKSGSVVLFSNHDEYEHNIRINDWSEYLHFPYDVIAENESFSFQFFEPGLYDVWCSLHPWMNAEIIVER